ncbi:MAG: hypothetical protein MK207_12475 [Saprospiraceae bacterium]|nr:hypothetical protein [Saprospiraceae bacterium]
MKKFIILSMFTMLPFLVFAQNKSASQISDSGTNIDKFTKSNYPLLRLAMAYNIDTIYTAVYFYPSATTGYDFMYDALYLNGFTSFQFATMAGTNELNSNALPPLTTLPVTIPLHTEISVIDNYSILEVEFSNFPLGTQLILEDSILSTTHDLLTGPYNYSGDPANGDKRFKITIIPNSVVDVSYVDENMFNIYKCGIGLCISLPKALNESQAIRIYNVLGQDVFSSTLEKGQKFFNLSHIDLPEGNVYFVELEGCEKAKKISW